jgi:hypothetical protein
MTKRSDASERLGGLRNVVASLNALARDRFDPPPLIAVYGDEVDPTWASYEDCLNALRELEAAIDLLEDRHRADLAREMVHALSVFAREQAGETLGYGQRIEAYAGVPGVPVPASILEALRRDVSAKLVRLGYTGPIDRALTAWRSSQRIDPKTLEGRIEQLVNESRTLADDRIVEVPSGCALEIELVRDAFFQGYSEYHGGYRGTVRINADLPWTNAGLKALIAHEGFAGHFLLNAVSEERARQGNLPPESSFYFANTPTWPIIEGACNMGIYLLGWFTDVHDEIQEILSKLRAALLINIAFMRHRDGASDDEIVSAFTRGEFFSREQAEQALRFIDHPLFHPSIPAYWHGTRTAFDALHFGLRTMSRRDVAEQLYRRTHTCATLRTWIEERGRADTAEPWMSRTLGDRGGDPSIGL